MMGQVVFGAAAAAANGTAKVVGPAWQERPQWMRLPDRRPTTKYDQWDAEGRFD